MKQAFNLFSEVLALPFSHPFMAKDSIVEQISGVLRNTGCSGYKEQVVALQNSLEQMSAELAVYLNQHTVITSISELQNMIQYVYDAEEILSAAEPSKNGVSPSPRHIANTYYFKLLQRIAKTFLTMRGTAVVFKHWAGSSESYPYFGAYESQDGSGQLRDLLDQGNKNLDIQRLDAWHSLLQCIPEELLISCYAALLAKDSGSFSETQCFCLEMLQGFGDHVHLSDALLDTVLEKGLAETHLHAGASRTFGCIWESMLTQVGKHTPVSRPVRLFFEPSSSLNTLNQAPQEASIVRLLMAAFLCSQYPDLRAFLNCPAIAPRYRTPFLQRIEELDSLGYVRIDFFDKMLEPAQFLSDFHHAPGEEPLDKLLGLEPCTRRLDPGLPERYLLSLALYYIQKRPEDTAFSSLLLYYLRLKCFSYRYRVQDSKAKGLAYFQPYYDASTGKVGNDRDSHIRDMIYTALRDDRMQKVELRYSVRVSSAKSQQKAIRDIRQSLKRDIMQVIRSHLYVLLLLYGPSTKGQEARLRENFPFAWTCTLKRIFDDPGCLNSLLMQFGIVPERVPAHRIGIIYHFIKHGEKYEKDSCFAKRKSMRSERLCWSDFSFGRARFDYNAIVTAITQIRMSCPEISQLIIGIDAASLEIPTEPWVFAPAFRKAREQDASLARQGAAPPHRPQRMLGLTYHVGEDFNHPISGLRHIDEAVEFFKLHTGDRLGHALALGIDLERWYSRHGLITMPCIEWLENCLWAWNLVTSESGFSGSEQYSKFLERQILDCAKMIYKRLDGITVESLFSAYRNKTLPCQKLISMAEKILPENACDGMDCFSKGTDTDYFPCLLTQMQPCPAWDEKTLSLSYHCAYFKKQMNRQMMIGPTQEFADLTKNLQQYLRRKIAWLGLVVESNPSSNATIGEIDGVLFHPVWGLRNSKETSPAIMASINTDDPSVFNASVANEHAYIYYALRYHGKSAEDALQIVDQMRQTGLDTSFLGAPVPLAELLREYEAILRALYPGSP